MKVSLQIIRITFHQINSNCVIHIQYVHCTISLILIQSFEIKFVELMSLKCHLMYKNVIDLSLFSFPPKSKQEKREKTVKLPYCIEAEV